MSRARSRSVFSNSATISRRMQAPSFRPIRLGEPGDRVQHFDVARDQRRDVRPQHLDDDGLAVAAGAPRAPARSTRPRAACGRIPRTLARPGRPNARSSVSTASSPGNGGTWSWSFASSAATSGRQQIGPHRQRLAELHEDRPELLEREPQAHAERLRAAAERQQTAHPGDRAGTGACARRSRRARGARARAGS